MCTFCRLDCMTVILVMRTCDERIDNMLSFGSIEKVYRKVPTMLIAKSNHTFIMSFIGSSKFSPIAFLS